VSAEIVTRTTCQVAPDVTSFAPMKRRDFLFGSLASVLYVACGSDSEGTPPPGADGGTTLPDGGTTLPDGATKPLTPTSPPDASDKVFPQGLASGDPRPDKVILWTRVEPQGAGKAQTDTIDVEVVIAKDEALTNVVARTTAKATPDADHTVRVSPTGLAAGTVYYYRFEAQGTTTRVGRTKTAPARDADVGVKFAFCSCQDYIGRYWHSWQALLDEKAPLDFILYLGDYIYETVNDPRFQSTSPDREIKLPDGMDTSAEQNGSRTAAKTLADYRTLYKVYRKDPVLKEVHRLYPFVVTWDDHEFSDDCWADHSTSFNELDPVTKGFTDEKNTPRRLAANRAFSEYQPADITYDANASFPNDIKIYRQLAFGKHVDLFMTDQRMFRDDHLVPEGPRDLAIGKVSANSSVGSRYFVRKSVYDERETQKKPTLLGGAQKAWLVDAVRGSKATWKVWGNEVQMYQMALRLSDLPGVPALFSYTAYVNTDQWDGFRSERAEILRAFRAANVENLLVCTGDIHAFFAAELHEDFDAPSAKPIGVEVVTAGISSASMNALVDNLLPQGNALRFIADAFVSSAPAALKASNPHLKHADPDAYGFALVDVDGTRAEVTFVQLGDPKQKTSSGVVARTKLVTRAGTSTLVAG
jgi:alkaline phosphatase D